MYKEKRKYIHPNIKCVCTKLTAKLLEGSHDTDGSGGIGTEDKEETEGGSRHAKNTFFYERYDINDY